MVEITGSRVVPADPRGFRPWVHPCTGEAKTQYSDGEIEDGETGIVTGDFAIEGRYIGP